MGSTKVKALVIESKDYKEKDKLITLYTLEQGKLVCVMRGVRGEKAKLKSAKEIFSFGEYVIEDGKGFNIITQAEVIDSFYGLTKDIDKYYEGCAIIDILKKISTFESEPALFIEIIKCLQALCYNNVRKYYCIDKFLLSVFKALGYSFVTNDCSSCRARLGGIKYFNLEIGEVVCPSCKSGMSIHISEACYIALKLLSEISYEKLSSLKLGGGGAEECYRLLEKNFEWRTGGKFFSIPTI